MGGDKRMTGIIITILALLGMFVICGGMLLMLIYFIGLVEILIHNVRVIKMLDRLFKCGEMI